MTEQEIRKFCDDFAFRFVTSSSIEPEFENVTGKSMRKVYEGLRNSLIISIHEFIDEKGGNNE